MHNFTHDRLLVRKLVYIVFINISSNSIFLSRFHFLLFCSDPSCVPKQADLCVKHFITVWEEWPQTMCHRSDLCRVSCESVWVEHIHPPDPRVCRYYHRCKSQLYQPFFFVTWINNGELFREIVLMLFNIPASYSVTAVPLCIGSAWLKRIYCMDFSNVPAYVTG